MNPTLTHPGQPQMQVEVILASTAMESPPIFTVRMRYPRIIHAEGKTHRKTPFRSAVAEDVFQDVSIMDDETLSRNAGSSRARPAKVTIQEVRDNPFIPWHWGKNQAGMQAGEENNALVACQHRIENPLPREVVWEQAATAAADAAEDFANAGYHKQIFNRLLEPFSWIDVLATGTSDNWENFLWLRNHEDAEPHIADLARLVDDALHSCNIQELSPGEWHLPYLDDLNELDVDEVNDWEHAKMTSHEEILRRISAARCARISYAPFGTKKPNIQADLGLYDKLVGNSRIHASPMEHQATPDLIIKKSVANILEPGQLGHQDHETVECWANTHLHGNLNGWIQHRKLIDGEYYAGDLAT